MEAEAIFSACWMDADNFIHLRLCHTHLEGDSHSLSNLASIRTADMETNNLVSLTMDQDLSVGEALRAKLVIFPFKRLELRVERVYVVGTILSIRLVFVQTDRAIFHRCEDCGRH